MSDQNETEKVSFDTVGSLDVRIGWNSGIVDRSTGVSVGSAKYFGPESRHHGFWLQDRDGRLVLHVRRADGTRATTWYVWDNNGVRRGSVTRRTRHTPRYPERVADPYAWGWIVLDDEQVAYVSDNGVFALDAVPIATLSRNQSWNIFGNRAWTLTLSDTVQPRGRSAAYAWLGVAVDLELRVPPSTSFRNVLSPDLP